MGGGGVVGPCPCGCVGGRGSHRGFPDWRGCGRTALVQPLGLVGWGGGLWLMSGVVQEDLSVIMPRVEADAIAPSRLWLLRLAMWQLGLIAGLVSVPVRVGLLLWHASGCPGLGSVLGVECGADACH